MSNYNPDKAMGCLQGGCPMCLACGRYVKTAPKGAYQEWTYWEFVTDDVRKEVDCEGYLGVKRRRVR